jgi:hypothetical protein
LDVASGTCVLEPVSECKCFHGGLAYQPGEAEFKIVNGERKKVEPCNKHTPEVSAGNACLSCKDGWEINQGRNNICKPKNDNCEISFYQGANYTGKVCHLTWFQKGYWDRDGNPGYYRQEVDDLETFEQYQEEMCGWMRQSGVGSIKRDYKILTGISRPYGCKIKIESLDKSKKPMIVDSNQEFPDLQRDAEYTLLPKPIRFIRGYQDWSTRPLV